MGVAHACRIGVAAIGLLLGGCDRPADRLPPAEHERQILSWQTERLERLTQPDGWLSLVGLFWLEPGAQIFGSGPAADLRLDDPHLPAAAGTLLLVDGQVTFTPAPGVKVLHEDRPIDAPLWLITDMTGEPTVLSLDSFSFYIVDRDGRLGLRVKDSEAPARLDFRGLDYYPVDPRWRVRARLHRYEPIKQIPIVNIVGMKIEMPSPGALVFELNGREYRLDPVIEAGSDELFVMFADRTSGKSTYGAGRYLYVPFPDENDEVWIDFNKAYSPPCLFSEFATCPLPPPQNRLAIAIEAGEKI